MPIIDYRCTDDSCSHVDSTFIPASQCGNDHPESEVSVCSKCQSKSERIYDYNGAAHSVGFPEIVVHLNTQTGVYSIPGAKDDELPGPEYKRVSITSFKQYEKMRSGMESKLREDAQLKQYIERTYFDQTAAEHRKETKARMEAAIAKGGHWVQYTDEKGITRTRWAPISPRARQLFDAACRYADQRRQQIRQKRYSGQPNFHSRILEHRQSEQSIVSGEAKRPDLPDLKELAKRMRRK